MAYKRGFLYTLLSLHSQQILANVCSELHPPEPGFFYQTIGGFQGSERILSGTSTGQHPSAGSP
jgi:hypothetical protein